MKQTKNGKSYKLINNLKITHRVNFVHENLPISFGFEQGIDHIIWRLEVLHFAQHFDEDEVQCGKMLSRSKLERDVALPLELLHEELVVDSTSMFTSL